MKHLIFIVILLALGFFSCKKEYSTGNEKAGLLKTVKASLKDSLSPDDYSRLDFSKIYLSEIKDAQIQILRIPFRDKKIENDFVLVQLNATGTIARGRIIHTEGGPQVNPDGRTVLRFQGTILISALNRKTLVQSDIKDGYITAFHPDQWSLRTNLAEPLQPYVPTLPEVIVMSYIHSDGISVSDWYYLLGLLGSGGGGSGYTGYYNPFDPGYGGGGGTGSGYTGSGGTSFGGDPGTGGAQVITDDPMIVDFENQYNNAAIEIERYMKCFSDIPDAGATGFIELCTDIPVNSDPSKFFDWSNGSPGHTFIQLCKKNGTQSVRQNIGFYPSTGWKNGLTSAPMDGKWVDNEGHEFNASYKINLTASQVQTAIIKIINLSHFVKYDIDDYNCTDWALNVFNEVVAPAQYLDIPRYDIPGGTAPNGTSTPNGLYTKLQQLKNSGGPEAAGITMAVLGWAGASNGPCN